MKNHEDIIYMNRALRLARKGLGQVAPNPSVGCLIVRDGCVIAQGRTQIGGRPHAETRAIQMALAEQSSKYSDLSGAVAYVTLEPCAHQGKTPPCTRALIESGISRVVIAMIDPDERVNGRAIMRLKKAGIHVTTGVCENEAASLNAGFILKVTQRRPLVTLKIAISRNGMMRKARGTNLAITSEQAQRWVHLMRAEHDAILIGAGTFKHDKPLLTCRLAGMAAYSPKRYIASTKSLTLSDLTGWEVLPHALPQKILEQLADDGITRLMLEGGPRLAKAFLEAGLVDRLVVFQAPFDLPTNIDALDLPTQSDLQFMGIENLSQSVKFIHISQQDCAPDMMHVYEARD